MTTNDLRNMLKTADLANQTDRLILADAMEESGREEEADMLRALDYPMETDGWNVSPTVWATVKFHGAEKPIYPVENVPVINPGGWFGKVELLAIGGSYTALYLVVEADNLSDAIDELADSKKWGHHIVVDMTDLEKWPEDYPEYSRQYGPSGQVLDLDHLNWYEPSQYTITYHGYGLPEEGMTPEQYYRRDEVEEDDE